MERINQWQQSGLRLSAFARQHELNLKRLEYWRTRLKTSSPVQAEQLLVPLRIKLAGLPMEAPDSPVSTPIGCLTITSPGGWPLTLLPRWHHLLGSLR